MQNITINKKKRIQNEYKIKAVHIGFI